MVIKKKKKKELGNERTVIPETRALTPQRSGPALIYRAMLHARLPITLATTSLSHVIIFQA